LFEITQEYFSSSGTPAYILSHLFTLIETLFLFYFFKESINTRSATRTIIFLSLGFLSLWVLFLFKQGLKNNIEFSYGLECILIIGLSIFYFFEQIKKPDSLYIYSQPRFWVVSAYLIYTAGTFFLFLYQDDLSMEEQKRYFILNSVFLILKTFILSIAMLMKTNAIERKKFQLT
jgi:hypothetical protein